MQFFDLGQYFKEKYYSLLNETQPCFIENEINETVQELERKNNQLSNQLAKQIDEVNNLQKQNEEILKNCNNTKIIPDSLIRQSTGNLNHSSIGNENGRKIYVL